MSDRSPLAARPASTVVLARACHGDSGYEVYFTRRPDHFTFVGGIHVFPGGAMDDADQRPPILARVRGLTAAQAQAELAGSPDGTVALAHWVTAVREVFEEAGVLLAVTPGGADADGSAARRALAAVPRTHEDGAAAVFLDHLEREDLLVAADRIRYFSHWITPPGPPRRFDTRFFVARLPPGQDPVPHPTEVAEARWLSPTAAIATWEAGELLLLPPAVFTLQQLSSLGSLDQVFARTDLAAESETRGNARLAESW